MPRTHRRKISDRDEDAGIFADNHGYSVVVHHKGHRREKRYKRSATKAQLRDGKKKLLHALEQRYPEGGTLTAHAQDYLASLPEGKMKANRVRECQPWIAAFGALPRSAITGTMIQQTLHAATGAASSKKKMLTALKAIWRFVDGPNAPTPVDHIKRPRETREVRGMPQSVVTMILRKLPRSKTRARLKVLARTGLPHAQIAAIEPHHLDLEKRELTVTPRRKGKGVPARTLPLTHKAVRAFKEFQRLKAWGPFSAQSMRKMFVEAVRKAKASWKGRWPAADDLRPYDLRHAFAAELYRRTRDIRAVAELLLHADISMAVRYTESAVSATSQAARDAMESATRSATDRSQNFTVPRGKSRAATASKRGTLRGKERKNR